MAEDEKLRLSGVAIVENLNGIDVAEAMCDGGAVDIIQRPAIDKQLVETIAKYARPELTVLKLDNQLIPRVSKAWLNVVKRIHSIASTNANAVIIGESGTGKEQVARQIFLHSSREQKPYSSSGEIGYSIVDGKVFYPMKEIDRVLTQSYKKNG